MEVCATPVTTNSARKRQRNAATWKRNVAKKLRYASKDLPEFPTCQHVKKNKLKCTSLKMKEIKKFRDAFYKTSNKQTQDAFLLKYCTVTQTKRRRPTSNTHASKKFQIYCHVRDDTKNTVLVCQPAFLGILGITKHRLAYVMKQFFKHGEAPIEKRGGNRKTVLYSTRQNAVMKFINQLKCIESHYCRGESARMYLSSDLNIKKLYRIYSELATEEEKVKEAYFRHIFNAKYNLSFGSPRTDVCSTCLEYGEKLKRAVDVEIKNQIMTEKKIHKARAAAFFSLLKEKRDDLITLSFDCQKNLLLPKVPDQSAYYSRQLYLYNFTIVIGDSKSKLTKENVFSYCWTENEFGKGSNEISSAVYDRLCQINFDSYEGKKYVTIRLVSDGCTGQNKNTTMLGMCMQWLSEKAPRNAKMELVFPVTGHSFLPPDRVFGNIEKKIRKLEVVENPQKYLDLISESATVIRMGIDCRIFDWKSSLQNVLKPPGQWHFQFKASKRFYLERSASESSILVRGEQYYKNDLNVLKTVTKKGQSVRYIDPVEVNEGNQQVNPLKLQDVNKLLLKHFGEDWRTAEDLEHYSSIIPTELPNSMPEENTQQVEEETGCEFHPEVPAILI